MYQSSKSIDLPYNKVLAAFVSIVGVQILNSVQMDLKKILVLFQMSDNACSLTL